MPLYLKCLLAVLFGALMTVAYAPFNAWWFQLCCLAGLFLLLDFSKRSGFILGAAFGLGWFGAGMWWVLPGMVNYSNIGWRNAGFLSIALWLYLSFFPALASLLIAELKKISLYRKSCHWLYWSGCAASWTLFEWLRANAFSGLPWLATGYAQSSGPLASLAALGGGLSLTYCSALSGVILASAIEEIEQKSGTRICVLAGVNLVLLYCTAEVFRQIEWTQKSDQLTVRLMQGNLSQQDKFAVNGLRDAIQTYANLASDSRAELTVMPETAIPLEWHSQPLQLLNTWKTLATSRNTVLLVGAIVSRFEKTHTVSTNSALAIMPGSPSFTYDYRYDKQHLIPFGEFFPPGSTWLKLLLGPNFTGLTPGSIGQLPLKLNGKKIAISICFEDLFDTEIIERAKQADALLSISNFAWFSDTPAAAQHLQIAQLRAIETGRWVMQAANSGRTAIVDQHGRIVSQLDEAETAVLDGRVDLMRGTTPFMRFGNLPLLLLCLIQIASIWYLSLNQKKLSR